MLPPSSAKFTTLGLYCLNELSSPDNSLTVVNFCFMNSVNLYLLLYICFWNLLQQFPVELKALSSAIPIAFLQHACLGNPHPKLSLLWPMTRWKELTFGCMHSFFFGCRLQRTWHAFSVFPQAGQLLRLRMISFVEFLSLLLVLATFDSISIGVIASNLGETYILLHGRYCKLSYVKEVILQ